MNAKELVDSLFNGYEQTEALADFKEELLTNMNAKIENFIRKGMDMETAFAKASAELGDVSSLADEMSLKKRKEIFEEVYMDIKMYMPARRVAGYVVFGVLVLWGITSALIALFSGKNADFLSDKSLVRFFGAMMPFLTAAVVGFTWLGVTQETASMNPVSKKRGAWYATAAGLIFFGLLSMLITYFKMKPVKSIIGEIIPFILPGIGILAFLILTEKDRLKPWAKNFRDKTVAREMALWNDPAVATRFGLFSGAIWMFAVGIFVLLGFLIGFKFSWLIFIFATAFQLLVQGVMSKRSSN